MVDDAPVDHATMVDALEPRGPSGETDKCDDKCADPDGADAIQHGNTNAILESIVPPTWTKVISEDDSPTAVPLEATNPAHRELWDSIVCSMQEVGDVVCVARNEHYDLWESFVQEKRKVMRKLSRSGRWNVSSKGCPTWNVGSGCDVCDTGGASAIAECYGNDATATVLHERPLFHTTAATTETIFQDGFDSRLSNAGNFGRGIYFSDDPKKCDQYWRGPSDTRVMFIAQVLLGEAKVYPRGQSDVGLTREPEREGGE